MNSNPFRIAAAIARRCSPLIDDLFTTIAPHLATMQNPNDVHFNFQGYDFLGQIVAKAIQAVLVKM
jgi:lysophospholipase L1-like esterase